MSRWNFGWDANQAKHRCKEGMRPTTLAAVVLVQDLQHATPDQPVQSVQGREVVFSDEKVENVLYGGGLDAFMEGARTQVGFLSPLDMAFTAYFELQQEGNPYLFDQFQFFPVHPRFHIHGGKKGRDEFPDGKESHLVVVAVPELYCMRPADTAEAERLLEEGRILRRPIPIVSPRNEWSDDFGDKKATLLTDGLSWVVDHHDTLLPITGKQLREHPRYHQMIARGLYK